MQLRSDSVPRRWLVTGGALVTLAGLGFALRGLLAQVAALILGAGVLSFVAAPLARRDMALMAGPGEAGESPE